MVEQLFERVAVAGGGLLARAVAVVVVRVRPRERHRAARVQMVGDVGLRGGGGGGVVWRGPMGRGHCAQFACFITPHSIS